MTDDHFTQKEMIVSIIRKVEETHDVLIKQQGLIEQILEQARKTNGRVTTLENKHDTITLKQEGMAVKISAAVFLATTIVVSIINKYLF